jgi:hypothetical protein
MYDNNESFMECISIVKLVEISLRNKDLISHIIIFLNFLQANVPVRLYSV